jgi:WD40 repeat protein
VVASDTVFGADYMGALHLHDLATGVRTGAVSLPVEADDDLHLSDDGRHLAVLLQDGSIAVVDTTVLEVVAQVTPGFAHQAVHIRGDLLAVARDDHHVEVINWREGSSIAVYPAHEHLIGDLALSPDLRWVATACWDGTVAVFETRTGLLAVRFHAATRRMSRVVWQDEVHVVAGGWDGFIRRFDLGVLAAPSDTLIDDMRRRTGLQLVDGIAQMSDGSR